MFAELHEHGFRLSIFNLECCLLAHPGSSDRVLGHMFWKAHPDPRPDPSAPRIQLDLRAVPLGDLGDDGEAESAAALAAAEDAIEAFEHAFAMRLSAI